MWQIRFPIDVTDVFFGKPCEKPAEDELTPTSPIQQPNRHEPVEPELPSFVEELRRERCGQKVLEVPKRLVSSGIGGANVYKPFVEHFLSGSLGEIRPTRAYQGDDLIFKVLRMMLETVELSIAPRTAL